MSKQVLLSVLVVALASSVADADDAAEARATLDQAIRATGGEAALSKIRAVRYQGKGISFTEEKKLPGTFEWTFDWPDKSRRVFTLDDGGQKSTGIEVISGDKGWAKDGDQPAEELSKEQVTSGRETIYVNWATMLVPLRGEGFRLSPLAETTVLGRPAVGILVRHDGRPDLRFYFDKESGLLVKLARKFNDVAAGKVFAEENVYSEFQEVQGTKQPSRATTYWDGKKVADVTSMETRLFGKPLDQKLFSKP